MKTYIITRLLGSWYFKYDHEFGINPAEWKDSSDFYNWVVAREKELPPEVAWEAEEVESDIIGGETVLQYEPTFSGWWCDHMELVYR